MNNGIKDVVKAFTILGTIVSIKALIDSQRHTKTTGSEISTGTEQLKILHRIESSLKLKGIID